MPMPPLFKDNHIMTQNTNPTDAQIESAAATAAIKTEEAARAAAEASQEFTEINDPFPWVTQLIRGKTAMAEKIASGEPLGYRVNEFWAESSWPLHTIDADKPNAIHAGDFLTRLSKQGLTPAMNVILHKKSNHHVGSIFGHHAFNMSFDYGMIENLVQQRSEAITKGEYTPKTETTDDNNSKAKKSLLYAAHGAQIHLDDTPKSVQTLHDKFDILDHQDQKKFPIPEATLDPSQWEQSGLDARMLCEKFGLRSVSVPLSFTPNQASVFIGKLDETLTQIARFLNIEPQLVGLDQCLGLRARSPGSLSEVEATATQDPSALAEKEREEAKKKKADSQHGMFSGNFIQIEISPNFEPVVLAHEWFHSLDLWFGSKEIVAKEPWRGWNIFATQLAFVKNYKHSDILKEWAQQLTSGGAHPSDFLAPIPEHTYLSQMRFDNDRNPPGEFYLSMAEILSHKFMRAFKDVPMSEEKLASTTEQSLKFATMVVEAARVHAVDHFNSSMTPDSLSRRRKEFFTEWGDVACMWANRQAEGASAETLSDIESILKAEVLSVLAAAWNWDNLSRHYTAPDPHVLQAMRMDALSGGMGAYFTTPHEMFAYKLEELFLSQGQNLKDDDKIGTLLLKFLEEEAVPALRDAQQVSFKSLMGAGIKKKTNP